MNPRFVSAGACLLFLALAAVAGTTNEPVTLFMPDGQIKSHLVRVYVSADLSITNEPKLTLRPANVGSGGPNGLLNLPVEPAATARFQHWTDPITGAERTGTLLLFDVHRARLGLKSSTRVTPVLTWSNSQQAVGDRVYLGSLPAAAIWGFLITGVVAFVIGRWASSILPTNPATVGGWRRLLLNPQGRLSLSKTQAAFWTICIAGMVLTFGLMRLEVPSIPESLVALMGLSLATRATIFITEKKLDQPPPDTASSTITTITRSATETIATTTSITRTVTANESSPPPPGSPPDQTSPSDPAPTPPPASTTPEQAPPANGLPPTPGLSDLIHSNEAKNPVAITKAQMVVWTVITGMLFCVKSLLRGDLWEVPWQLVTLMGLSQMSYVIPSAHKAAEAAQKRSKPTA